MIGHFEVPTNLLDDNFRSLSAVVTISLYQLPAVTVYLLLGTQKLLYAAKNGLYTSSPQGEQHSRKCVSVKRFHCLWHRTIYVSVNCITFLKLLRLRRGHTSHAGRKIQLRCHASNYRCRVTQGGSGIRIGSGSLLKIRSSVTLIVKHHALKQPPS